MKVIILHLAYAIQKHDHIQGESKWPGLEREKPVLWSLAIISQPSGIYGRFDMAQILTMAPNFHLV